MERVVVRNLWIRGIGLVIAFLVGAACVYLGHPIAAMAVVLVAFVLSKVLLIVTLRRRR